MSKTYDSTAVIVTVDGVTISGIKGAIQASRNSDMYSTTVDNGGSPTYSKSNDRSGVVTLPVDQSSSSNDYLSGLHVAGELGLNAPVIVSIKDVNGTTLVVGEGRIAKPADISFDVETGSREWTINMGVLEMYVGGIS